MRISDWSSDVCSSDLDDRVFAPRHVGGRGILRKGGRGKRRAGERGESEFAIHDNSCFEARASATHSQKQGVLRGGEWPILPGTGRGTTRRVVEGHGRSRATWIGQETPDRKSTRLNSSH